MDNELKSSIQEELNKNNNRRLGFMMTVSAATLILINVLVYSLYKTTKTMHTTNTRLDSINMQIKDEFTEMHEKLDDIDKTTESISNMLDEMIYRAQQDEKIRNDESKLMSLVRSTPRDTILAKGIRIQTENNDLAYTYTTENYEHTLLIKDTRNMFFYEKKTFPGEQGIYSEHLYVGSFNPSLEEKHYYNKVFARRGNDSTYTEQLDPYYTHAENIEQIEYWIDILQAK